MLQGGSRLNPERYSRAYNRVRPHSSLGYGPPAPETFLSDGPLPVLVGLTQWVLQLWEAGQGHSLERPHA